VAFCFNVIDVLPKIHSVSPLLCDQGFYVAKGKRILIGFLRVRRQEIIEVR
jgi:hypothetical protein